MDNTSDLCYNYYDIERSRANIKGGHDHENDFYRSYARGNGKLHLS